jgi:hypothetical protein
MTPVSERVKTVYDLNRVAAVISGKSAYKIKFHRNVNTVFLFTVWKTIYNYSGYGSRYDNCICRLHSSSKWNTWTILVMPSIRTLWHNQYLFSAEKIFGYPCKYLYILHLSLCNYTYKNPTSKHFHRVKQLLHINSIYFKNTETSIIQYQNVGILTQPTKLLIRIYHFLELLQKLWCSCIFTCHLAVLPATTSSTTHCLLWYICHHSRG